MLRNIITELSKVQTKKGFSKQQEIREGTNVRQSADFSTGTFQVRRKGDDIFKMLKKAHKTLPTKNSIPRKVVLQKQSKTMTLLNKQKLKETITRNAKDSLSGNKRRLTNIIKHRRQQKTY